MSDCTRYFSLKAAICASFVSIQACCSTCAQDFTIRFANSNPFGVNGPLPFGKPLEINAGKGFKGGIGGGISLQSSYNSNFFQSENNQESELSTEISPSLGYSTDPEGGARILFTAGYSPKAVSYLNNSNLNGVDQSGYASLVISGSRTVISAYGGYTQQSGVDRFAGGFVTGSQLSFGISGTYQLAPRTSVFANWAPSLVDYGQSSIVGFSNYSVSIGGSWAATELFNFGPSLSYSTSQSDNTGARDSLGFAIQASYKAAEKLRLAGSFGLQSSQNSRDSEAAKLNFTGSLSASYSINELWSWSGSIQSGVVPSPTQTNYVINSWSVSSSLNRSLLIGSISMGLDMAFSNFDQVGVVGTTQDPEQNTSAVLTYARPIFSDRLGFSTSVSYTLNSGQKNWSQLQLNAGLNIGF